MEPKGHIDRHTQATGKGDRWADPNGRVSNGAASQAYRDNYEATFGRKRKPRKVKA